MGPIKGGFYKPIELQMSIHQRPRIYIYIFEATNPDVPWWYQLYTPQKDQDVVQRGTPKKIKTMSFWRNHGHMWYPKFGKHPCRCSILFQSLSPLLNRSLLTAIHNTFVTNCALGLGTRQRGTPTRWCPENISETNGCFFPLQNTID